MLDIEEHRSACADRTIPTLRDEARDDSIAIVLGKVPPPPRHALRHWSPSRRPTRHSVRPVPHRLARGYQPDPSKDPAAWTLVGIKAAEDLGCVRNGMSYDKDYGTSAGYFEKPRRLQYMEGPNEPAVADHLEMNPRFLDFQMQPLDMVFRRGDGKLIHKYPDVGIEYEDHTVRFGEIKSDDAWFDAPAVSRPLARIDAALEEQGFGSLLKIKGTVFRTDHALEAHARAMAARLTHYDRDADAGTVRAFIAAAGGTAPYGRVVAAMPCPHVVAVDRLYAMLLRRVVSFDLSDLPTGTTPVTLPRPATAYALRDLLGRLSPKAA